MTAIQVSIVIPLYNKEQYINRALQSVFLQTFNNYEIIVVDDGSTDSGPDIVKNTKDPRVRLISQKNAGVSSARNRGIYEAKGELIAFLDADDEWTPAFLETIQLLSAKYPMAGLYATAYHIVNPDGKHSLPGFNVTLSEPHEGIIQNYFSAAVLGEQAPVWTSAVCVPKRIFNDVGGFLIGHKLGEDLEMWGKIAFSYQLAFSRKIGALYHRDVENSAENINQIKADLPFIETARAAINEGKVAETVLFDVREYIAKQQLWAIRQNILAGDYDLAQKMLKDCNTTHFIKSKLWWSFWGNVPLPVTRFLHNLNQIKKRWLRLNSGFR